MTLNLYANPPKEKKLDFIKHNTDSIHFSETTIPYITKHPNLSAKNAYNNTLKQIISGLKCTKQVKHKNQTFYETRTSVQYLGSDLISIRIKSDYNCDGLHPYSAQDNSLLFDLKNHRKLTLNDLFFKKKTTIELLKKRLRAGITKGSCGDKTDFYIEAERLFEDHLNYYLNEEGLVLNLKLPYGLRFCSKEIFISYSDLLFNTSYTNILKRFEKDFKKKK
jgi:hypothetical protein